MPLTIAAHILPGRRVVVRPTLGAIRGISARYHGADDCLITAESAAADVHRTATALAHAPQVGKQAQPSFYRFKLGTIEITVVSDGTLAFPAETLWGDRAEDARGLLTSTFQPSRSLSR